MTREIKSEDGTTYRVSPLPLTTERLERLWDTAKLSGVILSDEVSDDIEQFFSYVLSFGTVFFLVEDLDEEKEVGVLYVDNLIPGHSVAGHFLFWDRKLSGRQTLLLTFMREFMDTFDLHALYTEVPAYAFSVLRRVWKMGLLIEGRHREMARKRGEWHDVFRFGVLRSELTDEAIEAGELKRTEEEKSWHGLLDEETKMARFIVKERNYGRV